MLTIDIQLSFPYCVNIPVHPQAVLNTLSIGASLLLPPLRERTELLLSLLPQGPQSLNVLSKGQVRKATGCYFNHSPMCCYSSAGNHDHTVWSLHFCLNEWSVRNAFCIEDIGVNTEHMFYITFNLPWKSLVFFHLLNDCLITNIIQMKLGNSLS